MMLASSFHSFLKDYSDKVVAYFQEPLIGIERITTTNPKRIAFHGPRLSRRWKTNGSHQVLRAEERSVVF
jgi:hypothetical protein